MSNYQRRMAANADRMRQKWQEKKEQVRQWLVDNDAPKYIHDLLEEVATTPTYSWC